MSDKEMFATSILACYLWIQLGLGLHVFLGAIL